MGLSGVTCRRLARAMSKPFAVATYVIPFFEACARFVAVDAGTNDVFQAQGPATSTTAGEQEREGAAAAEEGGRVPWMSVLDEDANAMADMS